MVLCCCTIYKPGSLLNCRILATIEISAIMTRIVGAEDSELPEGYLQTTILVTVI